MRRGERTSATGSDLGGRAAARRAELGLADLVRVLTHDLAVVEGIADRGLVLDRGRLVDDASFDQLVSAPATAQTRALVGASVHGQLQSPAVIDLRLLQIDAGGLQIGPGAAERGPGIRQVRFSGANPRLRRHQVGARVLQLLLEIPRIQFGQELSGPDYRIEIGMK